MAPQQKTTINKYLLIIIAVLILLLSGTGYYLNVKLTSLNIIEQNFKVKSDSLRTTINKLGNTEKAKQVLIANNKDLGALNKDLKAEVDKEKGKVYNLTKIIASLNNKPGDPDEPIVIHSEVMVYPDSTVGLLWSNDTIYDKNNYRHLSGESKFKYDSTGVINKGTTLIKDNIGFNLVTGLRKLDGKLEIFVRSDYPGFNVTQLDGAIIDPKKNPVFKEFIKPKKFHFGPMVGFGIGTNFQFMPIIGVGMTYSIFSL